MNILIKLTCLIGLVIAPILGNGSHTIAEKEEATEINATENVTVEIKNINGAVMGTYTKISNGKTTTQSFQGTEEEVKAKINALK
jgi:K(+)-stimulated pyrophosphate-energized sodium pump